MEFFLKKKNTKLQLNILELILWLHIYIKLSLDIQMFHQSLPYPNDFTKLFKLTFLIIKIQLGNCFPFVS